jgi:hypothetical protein
MFELNLLERFFFCCEPGQIGVLPISGFAGLCEPVDQQVASSLIATPATQVGGAAVTTVVGGGATGGTGPMSTVTISSTLKNGGVTTITTAVAGAATPTSTGAGPASTGTGSSGSGSTSSGNNLSIGAIVGITIGGLALIAAAFMLLQRYCAGRNKQDMSQETYAGGYEGGQSGASIYSAMPAVQEYKSPAVGVQGSQGYGYGGTPPPQQGGYGPPVEAPQRWDGRVEMGTGR